MEPAGEPVLRYLWRSIPRGWKVACGLVLLALLAWWVSGAVEGYRRARLREEILGVLAGLPPKRPEPEVRDEDNAAPTLLEAMAAVQLGGSQAMIYGAGLKSGAGFDSEVGPLLEKNADAIRLLEAALRKPGFAPPPPLPQQGPMDYHDLGLVVRARAVVSLRAGRVGEAVEAALLLPRMGRLIGPGRAPPWNGNAFHGLSGILEVLEAAVADPRLDEAGASAILRELPSGEAARAAAVADFEESLIRHLGSRLVEYLGEDADRKAWATGWRPPTLHERLLVSIGKAKLPPGVELFPTAGQFREIWEASTDHLPHVGLRGPEAVRRFGTVPPEPAGVIYGRNRSAWFALTFRSQMGTEARLEVVRAAAALRLFEMRRGLAPASLSELTPSVLAEGTRDPYTGRPLVYRVDGDGWDVSSAGPGPEWASSFESPPMIRWNCTTPVPQDGGK